MIRVFVVLTAFLLVGAARPVDWSRTVTKTPAGAFVLGNPKAKVRLVEYLSYTCPHCAHYSVEAGPALRNGFVRRGQVAVEFRNAVRDRLDFVMALAARCGGPARFFGTSEALFAAQDTVMAKTQAYEAGNTPPDEMNAALKSYARASGVADIVAKRGVAGPQLDACLTNAAMRDQVVAMTKEAWEERKIPGTPTFLINGKATGGGWAQVEPQLKAALGG